MMAACLIVLVLVATGGRAQESSPSGLLNQIFAAQFSPKQLAAFGADPKPQRLADAMEPPQRAAALEALKARESEAADPATLVEIAKGYDLLRDPQDMARVGARLQKENPDDPQGAKISADAEAVIKLTKEKTSPRVDFAKLKDPFGAKSSGGAGVEAVDARPYTLQVKAGPYKAVPTSGSQGGGSPLGAPFGAGVVKALAFGAGLGAAAFAFFKSQEKAWEALSPGAKAGTLTLGAAGLCLATAVMLSPGAPAVVAESVAVSGVAGGTGVSGAGVGVMDAALPHIAGNGALAYAVGVAAQRRENSESERQSEYLRAKNHCDSPPPAGGDECSNLSRQIEHAEKCIELYRGWDAKWLPGRHTRKLFEWEGRLKKLKQMHNQNCAQHG